MEHDESRAPSEEQIDVDFEPEDELGTIAAAHAKLQKLRSELAAVKKERADYLDGWQRCKADAINAKKDAAFEAQRIHIRTKEGIAEEIIPVLDSFDMASATESWLSVDENWRAGMEQVRSQLLDVLARHGISRFGKVGDMYDPHVHEVVQEMSDAPGESGSIARILRYGYKSNERVIRPAQVITKS